MISLRFLALTFLAAGSSLPAQSPATASAPIKNFTYEMFEPVDGKWVRTGFIRGDEGKVSASQVDVGNMQLTVYAKDAPTRVDTVLMAPSATIVIKDDNATASGESSIRIVRDDLDASGQKWRYDHNRKTVVIDGKVHVIIQAQLKDILK